MLEKAEASLSAAVNIATEDALSPGWLRTREQIDGGAFPLQLLKCHTWATSETLLLDHHYAMMDPKRKADAQAAVKTLEDAGFGDVTDSMARELLVATIIFIFPESRQ